MHSSSVVLEESLGIHLKFRLYSLSSTTKLKHTLRLSLDDKHNETDMVNGRHCQVNILYAFLDIRIFDVFYKFVCVQ